MSTKIFVLTHRMYEEKKETCYLSLQVGKAMGKFETPYLGDDTGIQISMENPYYGELTGIYWIWKNWTGQEDYLGVCHYRRFFMKEDGSLFQEADFEQVLKDYDCMTSNATLSNQSNLEGYGESHNEKDLLACRHAIEEICPDYLDAFDQVMESKRCYYANLFVARRADFYAYCSWLFSVLDLAKKEICTEDYDAYHKRVYGFLAELLLNVWIKKQGFRVYEARIGMLEEKIETRELKEALDGFVKERAFRKGLDYYYDYLKKRPDVRLQESDFEQELEGMEKVLYILEQEEFAFGAGHGMIEESENLRELLFIYREVTKILRNLGNGLATEEEVGYLVKHQPSRIFLEVLLRNEAGLRTDLIRKILKLDLS